MPSESTLAAAPEKSAAARWTLPAVWVVVILIGTSWPAIRVGADGLGLDKLAHFTAYSVLSALVLRATRAPFAWPTFARVVIAVSLFGMVDEWHQSFIPGRSMSFADWIADSFGALVGPLAVRFVPILAPSRDASI